MENDDVESEEEDDTEDADAEEEEDRSQDRAACFVRACAVEMHFNISQEPLCTGIYRKTATPQIEPRMHTHTHTHLLAHFVRACAVEMHVNTSHEPLYTDIAGKMPRPRLRPERRYTLCASLRSRSACQHFTKATLYGHLQENAAAQKRDPHFVRACAVEMLVNISQESLHTEVYRKMPRPRSGTRTLCEPARSKCWSTFHKSHFIRKFTGKMPRPRTGTRTLCELAVDMHVNISQESLHTEVYRKNAAAQNRDPHFVRACSRNACQHFTKATLYGHLQEKCRGPEAGPALCASLRGRNAGQHFTRVTSYTEVYRKNAAAQKRDPHFVRACAVEMLVNISQESLHTEVYRKNAAAQNRDPHFVRACSRNACQHFTRVTSYGSLQEKCRGPEPGPALCASLQSKFCTLRIWQSGFR